MSENREFFERVGTQVANRSDRVRSASEAPEPTQPAQEPVPGQAPVQGSAGSGGQRRWAANDAMFWAASETHDTLPPGIYRCAHSQSVGYILLRQTVETDNLLILPDEASSSIISEFQQFWTLREEFTKRGFLHKRGYLLWGPPGSGKTSTVSLLAKELIETCSGIVLFVDHPGVAAGCLQMGRRVEPDRPFIVLMEDLDALIQNYGENNYLALLDGEAQVDNVVYVATTNYPERLDKRFVDRPSRFDTIKPIGMPSAEARHVYLKAKEPSLTDAELAHWVKESHGFSVAHLKEMIIANRCFGQPIDAVIKRLAEMQARQPTSEDLNKSPVGFMAGR